MGVGVTHGPNTRDNSISLLRVTTRNTQCVTFKDVIVSGGEYLTPGKKATGSITGRNGDS
jgi:hypothetical protein